MIKIIIILLLSTSVNMAFASRPVCVDVTAKNVAQLHLLAAPSSDPKKFFSTVEKNKNILKFNDPTVQCAKILGERLVNLGIKSYDPKAYERALGAGPAELAPDVANSINSGSVNFMQLGSELIWLSRIIPDVASGNYNSFFNTGTQERQLIRTMLNDVPDAKQLTQQYLNLYSPIIERQIYMLAMMVGK